MPFVTFGELMLRLSPPGYLRLTQTPHFEITFGGAEANVAVMIAQLGGAAEFVTKLPLNDIGTRAVQELRGLGVGVEKIVRGGDRVGAYFVETGASQRAGKVIYDRAHSAIAEAQARDFDWDTIFAGVDWFHWSGITPALSPGMVAITEQACQAAKERGLTVSFDLNYRAKLWTKEQAGATLRPLMKYVDLCVTSVEEAKTVFGLALDENAARREEDAAQRLIAEFGFKKVALTMRSADTANTTRWGAMLFSEGQSHYSRTHDITIVDRVGAGDSFSGALLFALKRGDTPAKAVEFAVAASTLKHTVAGDYARLELGEVEALAAGAGGGRVQR